MTMPAPAQVIASMMHWRPEVSKILKSFFGVSLVSLLKRLRTKVVAMARVQAAKGEKPIESMTTRTTRGRRR